MTGTPAGAGIVQAGDLFVGQVLANGRPIASGRWLAED